MSWSTDERNKQKSRFGDNPQGNRWANDKSGFGFKMLEKMGWSSGKGLGKAESGVAAPVTILRRANESAGLGVSAAELADPWLEHGAQFSAVLSKLNRKYAAGSVPPGPSDEAPRSPRSEGPPESSPPAANATERVKSAKKAKRKRDGGGSGRKKSKKGRVGSSGEAATALAGQSHSGSPTPSSKGPPERKLMGFVAASTCDPVPLHAVAAPVAVAVAPASPRTATAKVAPRRRMYGRRLERSKDTSKYSSADMASILGAF